MSTPLILASGSATRLCPAFSIRISGLTADPYAYGASGSFSPA